MARPKNSLITEDVKLQMVGLMHQGKSAEQIQSWLIEEHNIEVTPRTVAYHTSKVRKVEMEARRRAIQDAASKTALDCVNIIDQNIWILNREAQELLCSKNLSDKNAGRMLAETALKYMDKKLNLTGINAEEATEHETAQMLEGLMKKLSE